MPEWKLAVPKPGGSIPEGLLNKVMVGLATALVLALIISAGFCGGTDDDAESEEAGEPTEGAGIRPGAPVEDELQMVIDREERRIADAQRAAAAALLEAERLEELDRLAQLEADQASGFGNIPPEMRQALIDSLGILPDPELIELQRQARLENAARRITSLRANPVALSFRDGRGSGEATTRGRETGGNPSQADLLRALGNAGIQLPQAAGGAPPPGELDIPLPGSSRLPDYANPPRLLTPNDPPGWERVYEGQWLEAVLVTQLSGEFPGLEAAPADAAVSIDTQHLADHTAELADLDWKERGGRSFTPWNADVQDRLTRLAIPQTHHESPIERAAPRDLVDRVLAVERWYKNDWSALDTKLRTSIVEGISVFLAMFDLPDVARVFCPSPPPDPRNTTVEPVAGPYSTAGGLPVLEALPSLETLIEDGKVLAFNMPAGASPALARAAGVLLKNAWLQALLKRPAAMARAPGRYFRPAVFVCDEYQAFATVGEDDPSGDEKAFALTRQCRCIPIVATQSVSSLRSVLRGQDAWRTLIQTLRTRIFLSLSDSSSAALASEMCGKIRRFSASWSFSEQGKAGLSLTSARPGRWQGQPWSLEELPRDPRPPLPSESLHPPRQLPGHLSPL